MKRLHCPTLECENPDFKLLAEKYPRLKKYVYETRSGHSSINWKDNVAIRILNEVLLREYYQLEVVLPLEHLCPTINSRLDYVTWMHEVVSENGTNTDDVWGVDIGTGASCIYPLLGAKLYDWSFLCTEIDPSSVAYAKKNVESNNWQHKIHVVEVPPNTLLLGNIESFDRRFDLCMCNPPFFTSVLDAEKSTQLKNKGTNFELITSGGEEAFVKWIIEESAQLKHKVRWFSSLLGKKSSVRPLKKLMWLQGVTQIKWTRFLRGRTSRWALAWTYDEIQPALRSPSTQGSDSNCPSEQAATKKRKSSHEDPVPTTSESEIEYRSLPTSDEGLNNCETESL